LKAKSNHHQISPSCAFYTLKALNKLSKYLPFLEVELPPERILAMDAAKEGFSATIRTVFILCWESLCFFTLYSLYQAIMCDMDLHFLGYLA
jgi:hypothetical protein